ncbi:MAG: Phage capsid family protein [Candidatus Methanofastidiosum methylothiophilum]|uniref:Phage capsid family protein n=1 Tax=Candidatus Methanofastidiosum methylothiophilum TaxID=1705564 RepID=A0A150IJM8_9EURY|nr:MAG: Phage capsid family protein [Candidatus Methanofastidiosum methylthiophilus]
MDKEKEYISIIAKEVEKELLPKFPDQNAIMQDILKEVEKLIEQKIIKVPIAGENKENFADWLKKALEEGGSGGYLVPPEYVNRILDIAKDASFVLKRGDIIPVSSNIDYIPNLNTDVSFSWVAESATPTSDTTPVFGQTSLTIKKGMAITYISNEFLSDQKIGPAVDAYLTSLFGRAMGKEIDRVALVGSTSGGDPFNGVINTSGVTIVRSSSTTGIDYGSMVDCTNGVSTDYALEPVWIGHRLFYAKVLKIADTQNHPIFDPEAKTLLGYEYLKSERMPYTFTADKPVAIFGDLKNIRIGLRQDLTIESSPHNKFTYDQTTLRAKFRIGIAVHPAVAFVVYKTATV